MRYKAGTINAADKLAWGEHTRELQGKWHFLDFQQMNRAWSQDHFGVPIRPCVRIWFCRSAIHVCIHVYSRVNLYPAPSSLVQALGSSTWPFWFASGGGRGTPEIHLQGNIQEYSCSEINTFFLFLFEYQQKHHQTLKCSNSIEYRIHTYTTV